MKWIKTSERLPTIGLYVFVQAKAGAKLGLMLENDSQQAADYWREAYEEWLDESVPEITEKDMINFCEWPHNWGYERLEGTDLWYHTKSGTSLPFTTKQLLSFYNNIQIPQLPQIL